MAFCIKKEQVEGTQNRWSVIWTTQIADIALLESGIDLAAIQLAKLEKFLKWAGLEINIERQSAWY